MSLTEEQRRRFEELAAARRERKRSLEIERIKAEMRGDISDFAEHYEFADESTADKLRAFRDGLPYSRPGTIDCKMLRVHRKLEPENAENRPAWFCSLCGSEEIFDVFVCGELQKFLRDYDIWSYYGAYMLLVYDDFGGFVVIDDNGNMTEAFF